MPGTSPGAACTRESLSARCCAVWRPAAECCMHAEPDRSGTRSLTPTVSVTSSVAGPRTTCRRALRACPRAPRRCEASVHARTIVTPGICVEHVRLRLLGSQAAGIDVRQVACSGGDRVAEGDIGDPHVTAALRGRRDRRPPIATPEADCRERGDDASFHDSPLNRANESVRSPRANRRPRKVADQG